MSRRATLALLLGAALAAVVAAPAGAQAPPAASAAQRYFGEIELVNQHGQPMRLYSDLLRGKVVVINTFFATCTGVCPVMTDKMKRLRQALGPRVGRDVFLLSITVDPLHDTPAKLKEYAEAAGAGPGWFFLSGDPASVEQALRKLGQFVEARENHSTLFLVGNEPTGLWKKVLALADTEEILRIVREVADDQRPAG